jgi:3-hydroxy-5-methyl-1-naphthoate 3-O-methyltransferase
MNATMMKQFTEFRRMLNGFWLSRVILTANNYGLFDRLIRPSTAADLARKAGTDLRATEILLDALTALGLLKKTGGTYRNTPLAKNFLVRGGPWYQGDMVRHADSLWQNWSGLDEILKTGKPARRARNHASFIKAMHNNAVLRAKEVVAVIPLKGVRRALDLGGGPGTYSRELAKRGIAVTLFDLSETIAVAKDLIPRVQAKRISFLEGDFLTGPIGAGYDLAFISQVLHVFSAQDNQRIISKVREALNPGGRVAIHEFALDKSRTAPVPGALFSVNMLVNTDGGRSYSVPEMKEWLKRTGFGKITEKRLGDTVVVTGKKK